MDNNSIKNTITTIECCALIVSGLGIVSALGIILYSASGLQ
jgi:hypothetical protein